MTTALALSEVGWRTSSDSDSEPDQPEEPFCDVDTRHALTNSTTVHELVEVFERGCNTVRAAFAVLVAAEDEINAVYTLGEDSHHSIDIDASGGISRTYFKDADETIERMTRQAWMVVLDRMEIRRAMSISRYDALLKRIRDDKVVPPITVENVFAFVRQHLDALDVMWKEAIKEVFEWLRPGQHSLNRYKTNQKNARLELGKTIFISGAVDRMHDGSFRVDWRYDSQKYVALNNVFSGLDGKGMRSKTHHGALSDAIQASGSRGVGETEYFAFRCYKNRSMKLTFKRLDLLEKFNALAGGANLKPGEETAAPAEAPES
jgi:hypothetical protein